MPRFIMNPLPASRSLSGTGRTLDSSSGPALPTSSNRPPSWSKGGASQQRKNGAMCGGSGMTSGLQGTRRRHQHLWQLIMVMHSSAAVCPLAAVWLCLSVHSPKSFKFPLHDMVLRRHRGPGADSYRQGAPQLGVAHFRAHLGVSDLQSGSCQRRGGPVGAGSKLVGGHRGPLHRRPGRGGRPGVHCVAGR